MAQNDSIKINDWFVEQVIWDVSRDLAAKYDISEGAARTMMYSSGFHIYTTMDPKIQDIAESVYEDRSNLDLTSSDGQPIRSGITIVEPSTGNIVAIVGDMGEKSGNLITSYATDRRQVGSSMKPLTAYALGEWFADANTIPQPSGWTLCFGCQLGSKPWRSIVYFGCSAVGH